MLRVLHSSDLHGKYTALLAALKKPNYDVWVDTGDFFPNATRGKLSVEIPYQTSVINKFGPKFIKALAGRPVVAVEGNHDFISLPVQLKRLGCENVHAPNLHEVIEVCGLKWAGFRHIPKIIGEWAGEVDGYELVELTQKLTAMDPQPVVLLTHCPPAGILATGEYGEDWGNGPLTNWFCYKNTTVKYHLMGHVHASVGQTTALGVTFFNGATEVRLHEINNETTNEKE